MHCHVNNTPSTRQNCSAKFIVSWVQTDSCSYQRGWGRKWWGRKGGWGWSIAWTQPMASTGSKRGSSSCESATSSKHPRKNKEGALTRSNILNAYRIGNGMATVNTDTYPPKLLVRCHQGLLYTTARHNSWQHPPCCSRGGWTSGAWWVAI